MCTEGLFRKIKQKLTYYVHTLGSRLFKFKLQTADNPFHIPLYFHTLSDMMDDIASVVVLIVLLLAAVCGAALGAWFTDRAHVANDRKQQQQQRLSRKLKHADSSGDSSDEELNFENLVDECYYSTTTAKTFHLRASCSHLKNCSVRNIKALRICDECRRAFNDIVGSSANPTRKRGKRK